MVIAYSPTSHFHSDLEKARMEKCHGMKFCQSKVSSLEEPDPELDPKGYYMIITAKLSNLYYHDQPLSKKF